MGRAFLTLYCRQGDECYGEVSSNCKHSTQDCVSPHSQVSLRSSMVRDTSQPVLCRTNISHLSADSFPHMFPSTLRSQPQENLNDTVLDIIGDLFNKLECSTTSPQGPIEKYGSYFRVGLNNVTAALEKRELAFVLITVPVSPGAITSPQHCTSLHHM